MFKRQPARALAIRAPKPFSTGLYCDYHVHGATGVTTGYGNKRVHIVTISTSSLSMLK